MKTKTIAAFLLAALAALRDARDDVFKDRDGRVGVGGGGLEQM